MGLCTRILDADSLSVIFCLCLYACSLFPSLSQLSYFYNSEKHLSSQYRKTKNGAYSFSAVVASLKDLASV